MKLINRKYLRSVLCRPFFVVFLVFSSCKNFKSFTLKDTQGHWYTIEGNAGYLEFYIKDSTMIVCSDLYGMVYNGRVEVKNDSLYQYAADDSTLHISGEIKEMDINYMLLIYKDSIKENCYKIKGTLSKDDFVSEKYCFKGFVERKKASMK